MKRTAALASALILGSTLLSTVLAARPAEAQRYRIGSRARWGDFDGDRIPNYRDRDIDNDGIRNSRDRNDYTRRRFRVRGWRNTYRAWDWDRDGIPNSRDRHPRNRWRH
jgi:hypothetical protein